MNVVNVVAKTCLALAAAAALAPAARAAEPAAGRPTMDRAVRPAGLAADAAADAAAAPVVSDRPYATIGIRNVFALVPPPPPPDPSAIAKDPPPKITAKGITDIFGQLNVIFNVDMPAKPGQAGGPKSYMLKEGEREDDIEVVKIDQDAAVITFNNHDVPQDIPLVAGQGAGGGAGPAPGGPRTPFPAGSPAAAAARRAALPNQPMSFPATPSAANPGIGRPMTTAMNPALSGAAPNNPANNAVNTLLSGGSAPALAQPAQNQVPTDLTPEQAAILIEAERARLQTMDNPPYPPGLLPPTALGQKLQAQQQNEGDDNGR